MGGSVTDTILVQYAPARIQKGAGIGAVVGDGNGEDGQWQGENSWEVRQFLFDGFEEGQGGGTALFSVVSRITSGTSLCRSRWLLLMVCTCNLVFARKRPVLSNLALELL